MAHPVFHLSKRITLMPVVHGSGDSALAVRRLMLSEKFDCLAVPLPPSFAEAVEAAVYRLPRPAIVMQQPTVAPYREWQPGGVAESDAWDELDDAELDDDSDAFDDNFNDESDDWEGDASGEFGLDEEEQTHSYVPIEPCQPVIAAIRLAQGEHIPRKYIDAETNQFLPFAPKLPDAYALKTVAPERYASAVLPTAPELADDPLTAVQLIHRARRMAAHIHRLEREYKSILVLCSFAEWVNIRAAYQDGALFEMQRAAEAEGRPMYEEEAVGEVETYSPDAKTLAFWFGELPFVTGLYVRAAAQLEDDENLSIDGIKELLLAARKSYRKDFDRRARRISPHALRLLLKYVRNLTLLDRRLTPDLYTLVLAAKQIVGDGYALHVLEMARKYPYLKSKLSAADDHALIVMGIDRAKLITGDIVPIVSRLPNRPVSWRTCSLQPRPERKRQREWEHRWSPFSQCSWPPEDTRIENFRAAVFDRAKAVLGEDLARTEPFTSSLKDGLDIRDTLRNWHTGELYVRVLPPNRGKLDAVVMLFDSPADPRDYPWRTTWYAEHKDESTLAFYATDFHKQLVGPGIGLAVYGGAMFLYPPRPIPDIWSDRRLNFASTLEERLLAAACLHSESRHVALLAPAAPGAAWRQLARRYGKRWVHLPLNHFSDSTIEQLRMAHVLNGREVRSYAAGFIRKP